MPCIYAIRNKVNTKLYIGSTVSKVKVRFGAHRAALRAGRHHSTHLQREWGIYGEDSFELVVVEECNPEHCEVLEDYWIEYYDSANIKSGYNMQPKSWRRYEMTEEEAAECKNAVYVLDMEGLRRAIQARGET